MEEREELIYLIKELLNIKQDDKDELLIYYLRRSYNSIKSYLNYDDEDMKAKFEDEIVDLAMFLYKNRDGTGKIQMTQGSRNYTIERGIPKFIRDSLPPSRIKVIG